MWVPAEKGMSKLKQRFGLKKQGSKSLASADSSPSPSNLYPMAAGGHHPGNPHVQGQTPTPDPTAAHPGQRSSLHDPAYSESADLQEGHLALAGQDSGRLLVQGSAGNEEAEEQAMMELALKVGHCRVLCAKLVWKADSNSRMLCMQCSLHAAYVCACSVHVCTGCPSDLLCNACSLVPVFYTWRDMSLLVTCTACTMLLLPSISATPSLQASLSVQRNRRVCLSSIATQMMQESEVQAEYENVLREAKHMRMDLQHALRNCLEHKVNKQGLALCCMIAQDQCRDVFVIMICTGGEGVCPAAICMLLPSGFHLLVAPKPGCRPPPLCLLNENIKNLLGLTSEAVSACTLAYATTAVTGHATMQHFQLCRSRLNKSTQS